MVRVLAVLLTFTYFPVGFVLLWWFTGWPPRVRMRLALVGFLWAAAIAVLVVVTRPWQPGPNRAVFPS